MPDTSDRLPKLLEEAFLPGIFRQNDLTASDEIVTEDLKLVERPRRRFDVLRFSEGT